MDLTHAQMAGYVHNVHASARRQLPSHTLGFVGRHFNHGLLQPGHGRAPVADAARAFTLFKKTERPAHSAAMDAIEVPGSWMVIGLIPITIGLVIVQYMAFHISIPLG